MGTDSDVIRPLTAARLDDLAEVFQTNGATRGCWCMWFIAPNKQVHAGWSGGNRVSFEALAEESSIPLGLLAYRDDIPIGWCAAGPRSRYERALSPRSKMLAGRDESEDDEVWLVPCFFVRVGYRRSGTTSRLLAAAVDLAVAHGARAIEGFPMADDHKRSPDEYVGREHLFARHGFACLARPTPRRAVMRRDLGSPG